MKKAFVILLLISSTKSFAQEEKVLEPVIVEETPIRPPLNYPSAFSTVIDLEDFSGEYNTTSEILSFSPGVVVRDFGGFGQLKTLSIRGSSNDQVVILLDGVRLNSPLGGGVDLSTIPIDYVDKFEIIRGGASALAGSDAIGGVVNIVTKKTDEPFTSLSATYGSFETLLFNVSRAQKIGNLGYFFSYTHAQSNGDFEFKSVNNLTLKRINNEFHSESFLGKIEYDLKGWRIGFLNEFFYDDRGVPGLGEFQQPDANQKDIRNLTSINVSKSGFIVPNIDFQTIIFNRFDQLEFKNPNPTIGIPIDTLSKLYSFGINPRLTWYAPFNQIITVATELKGDVLRDEDFDNPDRFTYSFFLSDEISLFDDLILINPLVRYDLYKTTQVTSSTEDGFSPKLGIIYSPYQHISFKGNIGRSFRAPGFGELFFPEEGFIGGNPNLKPETSFDFDFGLVFSHPKIGVEINYFRSKIDDLILFVFVSAQRIEPLNVGKVTEQGIETSLILRPFDFLELFAGYTFLDGELEDTGAQLPGRPRNKFDLRVVFSHRFLRLFGETHYVDEIPLTPFPNSQTTDARTTFDVGGTAEWWKILLTIEVKNLFNNLDVRDALDFPLPGRTVFVKAGINF
ncbi:TonB-dependent receptor [Desulfobacterota bacterium AH_259_B03_O07]|nr:TonB-dependent receptor [Desulfobacterota bacterium AH_259_B03_O07]